MGERAVIEKGMETLESIGQGESTTFVLPQELSSLVGRFGKHLTGSDVQGDGESLDSLEFDDETAELLGLDDIEEIVEGLDGTGGTETATGDIESSMPGDGEDIPEIESDGNVPEVDLNDAELEGREEN